MRTGFIIGMLALTGCNENVPHRKMEKNDSVKTLSPLPEVKELDTISIAIKEEAYSNERFKEVTIEKVGYGKFIVTGKGQIFESSFGWIVEDGHNELMSGFGNTDAGAPEWGSFELRIDVKKERPNSVLHLILFETSAKDGSRQHELPIRLY
ncbi:MAG TPA: Gmad2 immunoglobulin-like domain-containing protein [Cytophagaceae bacterium]|jgi:hypothetical protein